MKLENYNRKNFEVRAIRITEENIEEAAQLVGSKIRTGIFYFKSIRFFEIPADHRTYRMYDDYVSVGDWLVFFKGKYRRYSNDAFNSVFQKEEDKSPKWTEVYDLVLQTLEEHSDRANTPMKLASRAANEIMELFGTNR